MEQILVAGANGTTGKKIIDLLENSQLYSPVAMIRKKEQEEQFTKRGIQTILADLEEDIQDVTTGMDKVIFAAGSGGKKVTAVDQEGAKKMMDAAKKHDCKKFVMLSSIGADQPEKADQLQDYLKAKHNADEYLLKSDLKYTIVRPGSLNNDHGTGKIKLAKHLDNSGSISRDDVAQTLVSALHDDVANNKTFEILNGDTLIADAMNTI
ncbi:SDR family oxidoreductase [Sediminibacter sp. Hel_I_10]|uniref:SDR family oxidoreductase n=1 Tax=Sediminibacter sp. Hel_I_10 TaxID=1392490 RepID=UPI00047BA734|nr:SDR family oxidoreductase [Sediminibacter sp. Hel_I_10]